MQVLAAGGFVSLAEHALALHASEITPGVPGSILPQCAAPVVLLGTGVATIY